ncbi:MAG: TIGR03118 family protein [Acidobacteriaceae bacterium]|nr:TIGR03118 family protein [Acidobacteriaceae bacterium]
MLIEHSLRSGARLASLVAIAFTAQLLMADEYGQINLVSDVPGMAAHTDPNLKNPWGVSFAPASPFWVSNQVTGTSTLYTGTGTKVPLTVSIPLGNPTGQVFNSTKGFKLSDGSKALFIFDTLSGTIDGWNGGAGTTALQVVSKPGALFTGLALAADRLYAADATGHIRVYNSSFHPVTLSGGFKDPNAIAGFVPFNIEAIHGDLYVTYAELTSHGTGLPGGYVDVFHTNGDFVRRVATGGPLYAPWGMTVAPAGFGSFGKDLLVGNFGNGEILAYDPTTGAFLGTLNDEHGHPIVNDFLWTLAFRTGGSGVNTNALYFTAGINNQKDGVFGSIIPTPEPGAFLLVAAGLAGLALLKRRKRRALEQHPD